MHQVTAPSSPIPCARHHLPALLIDLNALAVSGQPQPQVLEQAQEAVRQALQHVFRDMDEEAAVEARHSHLCAVGWGYASGEGRGQAAVQQALAHPLLHAAMQNPATVTKLGLTLSTQNEPLPMAELSNATRYVTGRFGSDIDMQVDYDPKATDVPAGQVKASLWLVWPATV